MDSYTASPDQPSDMDDASKILIKIMSPSPGVPQDLTFRVNPTSTIGELKESIKTSLDAKPSHENQRLIYRGKLLEDRLEIGPALAGNDQQQESYTIHLVLRPSGPPATSSADPSHPPPPVPAPNAAAAFRPTTAFRHANPFAPHRAAGPISTQTTTSTFQPNPNTRISTRTVTTSFTLPRPAGQFTSPRIPMGGPSRYTGMSLDDLRNELQNMRNNNNNPDLLRRTPGGAVLPNSPLNVPAAGMPTSPSLFGRRINVALGTPSGVSASLNASNPGLSAFGANVPIAATPELHIARSINAIRSMQQGNMPTQDRVSEENTARRRALQASLEEMQQEDSSATNERVFTTSFQPTNFTIHPLTVPQTSSPISNNSLVYLLQDPHGQPSALLVGPPGSALTNSTITNDAGYIPPNPPAGAGANAAQAELLRQIDAANERLREQAGRGAQIMGEHGNVAGVQGGRPAGMDQIRVIDVLHGVRARAGDLWLALKLIVFVILLAGNGGWRRVLYFSSIALLIFVWQTGIFNEVFRGFADVFNPQPPANAANQANQAHAGAVPQADTEMDPARTAQLLLERRGGRAREALRTVERGVAIFLASLVPGLHERHVRAVEQVQRAAQQQAQQAENANNENNDPIQAAAVEGAPPVENAAAEREPEPEPAEVGGAEVVGGVL